MYRIIACKGELLYTELVSERQLDLVRQRLKEEGYTTISCIEQQT